MYFEDGRQVSGEFKENLLDGYGDFIWPDNNRYIGFYENDKKHGLGLFYCSRKKATFIGNWKYGKRDGPFLVYKNNKQFSYSFWKNNERIYRTKDSLVFTTYINKYASKYLYLFKKLPKDIISIFTDDIHFH